jgi:hypothetical protein
MQPSKINNLFGRKPQAPRALDKHEFCSMPSRRRRHGVAALSLLCKSRERSHNGFVSLCAKIATLLPSAVPASYFVLGKQEDQQRQQREAEREKVFSLCCQFNATYAHYASHSECCCLDTKDAQSVAAPVPKTHTLETPQQCFARCVQYPL